MIDDKIIFNVYDFVEEMIILKFIPRVDDNPRLQDFINNKKKEGTNAPYTNGEWNDGGLKD